MALFGKKKKVDVPGNEPAENKESNSVTEEMKIILEAREEEQQEKEAKALERQIAQEESGKEIELLETQAKDAADKILKGDIVPAGMNFYLVCDEIPMGTIPEKEGNLIVRGNIRGTVKKDTDVFLYQGKGDKFSVRIERIRNDNREYVDELSDERAELEITRGDIPQAVNPDEDASRPVQRFAVLTDAKGIEDMSDPACKGMAGCGNPRTIAMLCEYGRFNKEPLYFGTVMDSLMTSEFITIVKMGSPKNGRSSISFAGVSPKKEPDTTYLPVFTDNRLAMMAQKSGFGKQGGLDQRLALSFAQVAAISRDNRHQGFLVNPGGPVTITIPKDLIDKMVETPLFIERFGPGAGDNASLALGGSGNRSLDNFIANGGPNMPGIKKMIIKNPTNNPEFMAIEKAVRSYCGSHADIAKLLILVTFPEDNPKDQSYLCLVDCPEDSFSAECKGLLNVMKPFLRSVKKVQFQLYSKFPKPEGMAAKMNWLYSKLPQ